MGSAGPSLSIGTAAREIYSQAGILGFWRGLSAAVLRQIFYGGLRFGLYEKFKSQIHGSSVAVPTWQKICAGFLAGGIAATICTPFDVIKTRTQAVGIFNQQYTGLVHATESVVKAEGFSGLWTGWKPTANRAAIVAVTELATYDECKDICVKNFGMEHGFSVHLASSMMAGLIASVLSVPVDVVKTRVLSQPIDSNGRGIIYRNSLDCVIKSIKAEGVPVLFRGLTLIYLRRAPHLVITFLSFEQMRAWADKFL